MCLIIETRDNIPVSKKMFEVFTESNKDGFGMMYLKDSKVLTFKSEKCDVDEIFRLYNETKHLNPFFHFRMRTHGEISDDMAHPYDCGNGVYLMHNGVMGHYQGENKTKSDTWYFVEDYVRPFLEKSNLKGLTLYERYFQLVISQLTERQKIVMIGEKGALVWNANSWHTIRDEDTGCVGMRVSNTYAWHMARPQQTYDYGYGYAGGTWTRGGYLKQRDKESVVYSEFGWTSAEERDKRRALIDDSTKGAEGVTTKENPTLLLLTDQTISEQSVKSESSENSINSNIDFSLSKFNPEKTAMENNAGIEEDLYYDELCDKYIQMDKDDLMEAFYENPEEMIDLIMLLLGNYHDFDSKTEVNPEIFDDIPF